MCTSERRARSTSRRVLRRWSWDQCMHGARDDHARHAEWQSGAASRQEAALLGGKRGESVTGVTSNDGCNVLRSIFMALHVIGTFVKNCTCFCTRHTSNSVQSYIQWAPMNAHSLDNTTIICAVRCLLMEPQALFL